MPRKVTRRGMVAGALAAVPALAQAPPAASASEPDPARANLLANMEAIRKVPLDVSVQPAFVFKP